MSLTHSVTLITRFYVSLANNCTKILHLRNQILTWEGLVIRANRISEKWQNSHLYMKGLQHPQFSDKDWLVQPTLLAKCLFQNNLICMVSWYEDCHGCQYWNIFSTWVMNQVDRLMWHFPFGPSFSKLLCCFKLTLVYLALGATGTQSPSTFLEKIKFRVKNKRNASVILHFLHVWYSQLS